MHEAVEKHMLTGVEIRIYTEKSSVRAVDATQNF